jgi:hypothetical protein
MSQIIIDMLKSIVFEWVSKSLLVPGYYGDESKIPCVSFEVAQNQSNHHIIKVTVRCGAFGEIKRMHSRTYYYFDSITKTELTNLLLFALTFEGSPYFIGRFGRFEKRLEIM